MCYFGLLLLLFRAAGTQATITSNSTVTCPDEAIQFTCTLPGTLIRLDVTLTGVRMGSITLTMADQVENIDQPNFMFEGVLTDISGGNVTATLTTVTEVSLLDETMVTCVGESSSGMEGPLIISVVSSPSPPLSPRVLSSQDGPSSSNITLQWSSPLGDSSLLVHYILTILPTPLSQTPVTVETTLVQITVSYNTLYNVTIRAENCAGTSEVVLLVDPIVACPSNPSTTASGVVIDSLPSVPTVGSILVFTCTDTSVMETSTCDSQGRWSPDPETYSCPTIAPPVMCPTPFPPVNGIIWNNTTDTSPVGTVVYYRCEDGLFPVGNLSSTCDSAGMWNPINPQDQLCSPEPFTCTVPEAPTDGFVVLTTSNTTIVFGCNEGFSPQQNRTANCVAMNQWSSLPEETVCVAASSHGTPVSLSTAATVGVTLAVSAVVFTILGFLAGLLVMYLITRKKAVYSPTEGQANIQPTAPAGPVYEDVLPAPKEEIELKTNDAYGPVRQ